MCFNYSKLSGKIVEKYGTQQRFSEVLGVSERTLSLRLNNKRAWKATDIQRVCTLLDIQKDKIHEYFFDTKVQEFEQKQPA